MLIQEVVTLIKKEFLLEWRQRHMLSGVILYLVSTIFVCYLSFNVKSGQLNAITWNALFWIIILFVSTNAIAKSFQTERFGRMIYYYTVASPEALIISKMIYNAILILLLSTLGYILYGFIIGNPVGDVGTFYLNLVLGSVGFSSTLTMISAIASKTQNSNTLMVILGFPIILPILLMIIKTSKNALDGLDFSASYNELGVLLSINVITIILSYILFPYLWRS